ncbi:MAG TPA: hypothetical protein VFA90_02055 [Terriglobales bacterium]|nr:hypothetical protein [Terriglobales bacterium]
MKLPAIFIVIGILLCTANSATSPDAAAMQRKLDFIEKNGRSAHANQKPTVFTEEQVNAYIASDYVKLPNGVESVKLAGESAVVTGNTRVDFDRIREGIHSSNPLLSMFSGVHDVVVITHAHGEGGRGYVHVDSVSLDGIEVPRFVLQMFVEKFLTPKYPEIGLDSQFALPDRIDSAKVGEHELTIIQK